MDKIVTVVLRRDGTPHATLPQCSPEDARRWAEEGYVVFQLWTRAGRWAVCHVETGKVFTSETRAQEADAQQGAEALLQIAQGRVV